MKADKGLCALGAYRKVGRGLSKSGQGPVVLSRSRLGPSEIPIGVYI